MVAYLIETQTFLDTSLNAMQISAGIIKQRIFILSAEQNSVKSDPKHYLLPISYTKGNP